MGVCVNLRMQIANRINAKRGGVKTQKGKNQSKMNALKHGLLSEATILPGDDTEVLADIIIDLHAELRPQGQLEEITYEAYGPNGTPLIIEVITDNKNRTLSEIKHILNTHQGKLAEAGSVKYMFEKKNEDWEPKYPMDIADENLKTQLEKLFEALDENEDVKEIYSNINL